MREQRIEGGKERKEGRKIERNKENEDGKIGGRKEGKKKDGRFTNTSYETTKNLDGYFFPYFY